MFVNVDGREQELAFDSHLLQPHSSNSCCLADRLDLVGHARALGHVSQDGNP